MDGGGRELGAAEKIMSFMRAFMPLSGWTRARLTRFPSLDDLQLQAAYFDAELDNWRFRYGLDLLLSPLSLRGVYSPALLECLPCGSARTRVRVALA